VIAPDGQKVTITATATITLQEAAEHIVRSLIAQIRACLNAGMNQIAVLATLVLPDMCAAAERSDGEASGAKYKAWVNAHIAPKYLDAKGHATLSGDELYALRCAVAHQMRLTHPKLGYSTIWFSDKHNVIESGALHLSPRTFCEDVLTAVENWLVATRGNAIVVENLASLSQRRVVLGETPMPPAP
jgi:hypothetical protein